MAETTGTSGKAGNEPNQTRQTRRVTDEIAVERRRQVREEGWSPKHDDEHWQGELAAAAACYALRGSISDQDIEGSIRGCHPLGRSNIEVGAFIEKIWPRVWDWHWWKPTDRRRNLVKAAALIVAEIERLDRAALSTPTGDAKP